MDTLGQIVIRCYSCKRKTNRWPVALFMNLIDITTYNAFLLYCSKNPDFVNLQKVHSRGEFLKILTSQLLPPNKVEEPPLKISRKDDDGQIKWCQLCPRQLRKTKDQCSQCKKWFAATIRTLMSFV